MIQNLEIRKDGDSYLILEQAGSNYHAEETVHPASSREQTEQWLLAQGVAQADVTRALTEIANAGRVFVEVDRDYSEAEGFPRQA